MNARHREPPKPPDEARPGNQNPYRSPAGAVPPVGAAQDRHWQLALDLCRLGMWASGLLILAGPLILFAPVAINWLIPSPKWPFWVGAALAAAMIAALFFASAAALLQMVITHRQKARARAQGARWPVDRTTT